ncbi:MAG: DUF192 domain-containing protein [Candidatus Paceibacterota bacterium]
MRHSLIYIAAAAVAVAVVASIYAESRTEPVAPSIPIVHRQSVIVLKGQMVRVTVASTPAARQQGLSGRSGLAQDEGMLFVFPEDGEYGFWMKDMLFPIDIVWLDADGTVVYIAPEVSPDSYPTSYRPATSSRYVVELPAGWVKVYNLSIGDRAEL